MSEHAHPTTSQLVAQIAEALGETEPPPLEQIRRLVKVMGQDFAQELLRETQAVEAAGGLFLEREQRLFLPPPEPHDQAPARQGLCQLDPE